MNRKLLLALCVSLLCGFFSVGSVLFTFHKNSKKNIERENMYKTSNVQSMPDRTNNIKYYFVINENDALNLYAVYENGERKYKETVDEINVGTMRFSDREIFKKGVILKDEKELIHMIEDYTG